MKNTNKILLVVLLVLLSAFVLTKMFRTPGLESNLDTDAFRVDTAKIASISFYISGNNEKEYTLNRNDSAWSVERGEQSARVRSFELKNLLRTLSNLKPERIVSRRNEKWDEYQVGDTSAIRLTIVDDDKNELAEWFVGAESRGMTYVRPSDEGVVYAVSGNLPNLLGEDFDHWRDRTFLQVSKALVNSLTFRYPADSGFVIKKDGGSWIISGQKADSSRVGSYLATLQSKELTQFEDGFTPSTDPDITLTVGGASGSHAMVKAWKGSGDQWILTSTFQNGVYFRDSIFTKDLFRGKNWFLEKAE